MQAAVPSAPSTWRPRIGCEIRYRLEDRVDIAYRLDGLTESWTIPEIPVPEAPWHDRALERLKALLVSWVGRNGRDAIVFRDVVIGVRKDKPRWGFNPDICIVEPPPPSASTIDSVRLWEPGHRPPVFVVEVVSRRHPYKDYVTVPDKCGLLDGVKELVVFDPWLAGPEAAGGPYLLQFWRRTEAGLLRTYCGSEPVYSEYLDALLVPDRAARRLNVASRSGEPWQTPEEEAHDREVQARDAEAQAREAAAQARERELSAQARIAELEAELRRLRGDQRE
jgi:Uma2 family endonuclease